MIISKPGKDLEKGDSSFPISLLPILSEVFKKLLLKKVGPNFDKITIKKVVRKIGKELEAFLDISPYFLNDVARRFFINKTIFLLNIPKKFYAEIQTMLYSIKSGIPCGSLLGPLLYLIRTRRTNN